MWWKKSFVLVFLFTFGVEFSSAAEKVLLDGSTGMLPLASALAKAYQQKFKPP